ncbi:hypothetical protein E1301_Tti016459 [Triplophysa tibetana]|uniref:EF-hand calcium-binding domain-containing protein 12 n=1 Tax=Triplophysa tibetana TaxID=1572043 RepID=A0A5A9NSV9_9TELE|nr:hypothetical protein E1301_Tti016459 [Triplophysa tibetana]
MGPQKCKNSDIRKHIVDNLNTARAQPRHFGVLPSRPAAGRNSAVFPRFPGNKPLEHPEWISNRKAFREALDGMGDLRRWLHNKPILTDLEVLVTERRPKKKSYPETYISPDAANSPRMLTREIEDVKRYLCTHTLSARKLAKLLDWHGTGQIRRADLRMLFEKDGFFIPMERMDALMISLKSQDGNSVGVDGLAAAIQAWSRKHQEMEKQTLNFDSQNVDGSRHNLETHGITLEERKAQDQEDIQDVEVLAIMRRVLAATKISCPSSLGGLMGRNVDHFRGHCFREYLKSVELCQQQGLIVNQATLKKALVHPSDMMCSSSKLKGKGHFPGLNGREQGLASLSTHKTFSLDLKDGVPHKGYKKLNKLSVRWADPNAFWPGREDHVRLLLPVMTRSPAMVLFQHIERSAAPSPGNWPINHLGYSTSGDIEACKIYTL